MRLRRFAVPAALACTIAGGAVAFASTPASAATCTATAKQDANGRWHNPDGEFCARGSTTTTPPVARTVPPTTRPATPGAVVATPKFTG